MHGTKILLFYASIGIASIQSMENPPEMVKLKDGILVSRALYEAIGASWIDLTQSNSLPAHLDSYSLLKKAEKPNFTLSNDAIERLSASGLISNSGQMNPDIASIIKELAGTTTQDIRAGAHVLSSIKS